CKPNSPILRPRRMDRAEESASTVPRLRAGQSAAPPEKMRRGAGPVLRLAAAMLAPLRDETARVCFEAAPMRLLPFFQPQDAKFPAPPRSLLQAPQMRRHQLRQTFPPTVDSLKCAIARRALMR